MKQDDMELVSRLFDADLSEEERELVQRRMEGSPDLRGFFQGMESLDAAVRELPLHKAPPLDLSTRSRVRSALPFARPGRFPAVAAAAAACFLLGFGLASLPRETPVASPQPVEYRIVYYAPQASSVSVLGDFNKWTGQIPLSRRGVEGYWTAEVSVLPGEYRYVLVVDGGRKVVDPAADYVIDDDFGSKNSVVKIGI